MKKTITTRLTAVAFTLIIFLTACHKDNKVIPAELTKYANGFFIINEGSYQNSTGNVSFYSYSTKTKEDSVFSKENPGKTLDPNTSTLEYATIFNNKLFLVSKYGGPFVIADAISLKEIARIDSSSLNDWRAFVGVSTTSGLLGSSAGLYRFNLTANTLGTKVTTINGETGDMIKAGNYIFVLSKADGLVILNTADYSVAKKIAGITVGFAKTPDGSIWAAGISLLKINPANLNITSVNLPFTVNDTWGAWHPGSITASTKENTIYIADNDVYTGASAIYKYTDGNGASLQTPFITLPAGRDTYGAGIGYNAKLDELVVTAIASNYKDNDLYFYDTAGVLKVDLAYSSYSLPAMLLFQNQ